MCQFEPVCQIALDTRDRFVSALAQQTMRVRAPIYRLTTELVAQYGGNVVLLEPTALGRRFRLYTERPGVHLIQPVARSGGRADAGTVGTTQKAPALVRIDIMGVLEQRAGYHDACAGWSDGHDAIAERYCKAFETSDVLTVFDSPGGAAAGTEQAIDTVLKAKAQTGRHVTGWVDELCGSAAVWWAATVCDEIYSPAAGMFGSIGARSAHISIAQALAKAGVEYRGFAWPPKGGKLAFAPEMPLSETAKRRAERDVTAYGKAFARAVANSLGPRLGLTYADIINLDADVLRGKDAVSAKLIDGVSTYAEVVDWAMRIAEQKVKS